MGQDLSFHSCRQAPGHCGFLPRCIHHTLYTFPCIVQQKISVSYTSSIHCHRSSISTMSHSFTMESGHGFYRCCFFIYAGQYLKRSGVIRELSKKTIRLSLFLLPLYIWAVNYNGGSSAMYYRDLGRAVQSPPLLSRIKFPAAFFICNPNHHCLSFPISMETRIPAQKRKSM